VVIQQKWEEYHRNRVDHEEAQVAAGARFGIERLVIVKKVVSETKVTVRGWVDL
jgi:hypothetical protein